jgi:hypothetical protein
MTIKRMSLVEGMKRDQEDLDPATVESFVKHGTAPEKTETKKREAGKNGASKPALSQQITGETDARPNSAVMTPGLIPVNVRVRPEIAAALKAASLQRELQGIEPYTKREIVEEALEPWLKRNGYL